MDEVIHPGNSVAPLSRTLSRNALELFGLWAFVALDWMLHLTPEL
jgi:hypothetical protein